jgi:hypothetical protein
MRPEQSLDTKLDAYKALSGDDGIAGKARRRSWAVYATAAGSSMALATSAEAGIIYSGVQNVNVSIPQDAMAQPPHTQGTASFKIDIDGQGHNFTGLLRRGSAALGGLSAFALLGGGSLGVLKNGSGQLKRLVSGAKISGGAGLFSSSFGALRQKRQINQAGTQVSSHGTWPKDKTGFAGVEFTQGGQEHFGWVRLEWGSAPLNAPGTVPGFPVSLTAIDWAYETDPNVAITAGSVPEPSTGVLGLLACGSVGVLAWRKRKQQRAANASASSEVSS